MSYAAPPPPDRPPPPGPARARAAVRVGPGLSRVAHPPWGARVGIRAFFALISLFVIVASGIAWVTYHNFTSDVPHGDGVPGAVAGHDPDGGDQNILLVGSDTRAGATRAELDALHTGHDKSTANADTMMVLHIPSNGSHPTIVSFPRDSWVEIPGYGRNKINAAYPDAYNDAKAHHRSEVQAQSAGLIETIKTIQGLTGLSIDHYMQVDLIGFYRISEAIGGVTVCLNHAQNRNTDADEYHKGYSGIDLPKGTSVIKGKQALAFVRQRHGLPHGDLDRVRRQQYFLKAAFAKITSAGTLLNPFKLQHLLDAVGKSLLTDPKLDLLKLAQQFASLTSGKIDVETIPNNGPKLIYPDGVETSIVEVNKAALPAFVQQLQGKNDSALKDAKPATPTSVVVDVLNGTDTTGLAARNGDALKRLGFKVNTVDSASTTGATAVQYPPGKESAAKAVLAVVPKAKPVATPDVKRVTVVLGGNGVVVKGVAVPKPAPHTPATGGSRTSSSGAKHGAPADGLGCID